MKNIFKIITTTAAAATFAVVSGATAHAGGFRLDISLPFPPLPPIPTPFGFVDVNPPAPVLYLDAPTFYAPAVYAPRHRYAPAYRHVYRPAYRKAYTRHYVRYYDNNSYDRDRVSYSRHMIKDRSYYRDHDRKHNRRYVAKERYNDRYDDRYQGRGGWRR